MLYGKVIPSRSIWKYGLEICTFCISIAPPLLYKPIVWEAIQAPLGRYPISIVSGLITISPGTIIDTAAATAAWASTRPAPK